MNFDSDKALVILSGGQDSTTCLGWALDTFEHVECITFDYGQTHAIELDAAKRVVEFFAEKCGKHILHTLVTLGPILAGTSPLTNRGEQLETYTDHASMEAVIGDRVEKTFVPMRNALFLVIAANHAAVHGIGTLVTGVCEADNANYPDCRRQFVGDAESMINSALGTQAVAIATPLMHLGKAESIHFALSLPFTYDALAFSHTAYDGQYPPTGKDHASVLRAHGFEQAGVPDPLVMRAVAEGLMEYPATENYEEQRLGAEGV